MKAWCTTSQDTGPSAFSSSTGAQRAQLGDRTKDERWIYQPNLVVTTAEGKSVFVAKDFQADPLLADDDGEIATNALLYRHAREFATGHGVAAGWAPPTDGGRRTTQVFTEFIPKYEVPLLIAPSEETGGATLDMKVLAEAKTASELAAMLEPMAKAYEEWIATTSKASEAAEIQSDPQLRDAARVNLDRCTECAVRIRAGAQAPHERLQCVRGIPLCKPRDVGSANPCALGGSKPQARVGRRFRLLISIRPTNRTWRPFQMGFILLNLRGIADESSPDRRLVDLLWFPTGGGKTEAYLGLSAFTLALRRLSGDRHGMHGGAGVSIIMRYTLRLLTVQQFQRAAALICACELVRSADTKTWGDEPFRIGVWVGRGTTPNTFADSQKALEDLSDGKKPKEGSPVQLVSCPRCGTALVTERGVP